MSIFREETVKSFHSDLSALMADIDYSVTAVAINKEEKINRGMLPHPKGRCNSTGERRYPVPLG